MKKVLSYIIALALPVLVATSCSDVLDQQSVDSFNQEVVFSDINVVKAYLGKCYDRLGGIQNATTMTSDNNGILGMREDLLSSATDQTLCIHRPSNYGNLKGTLSPDQLGYFANTGYAGFMRWPHLYSNIQNINNILANIDAVPTTTAPDNLLKTRLKGEAYFLRAYEYATLLMTHGGVVLRSEPWTLDEDYSTITRSTLAQTKDFVLADIDQAITILKDYNMEQGRANQAAAAALKSRVLLFCASKLTNGGYEPSNTLVSFPAGSQTTLLQAARDAAKDLMDGKYGTFSLVGNTSDPVLPLTPAQVQAYSDTYFGIFNQKGKWNSETIWGIQYPLTGGNGNRANIWFGPCGYHNWGNNDPTEPAVRSFEMADGTPFVWDKYTPGDQYLRTATAAELVADPYRNPYYGREPRFYAIVLYHGAPWQARPSDAAAFDPYNKVQTGHFYNPDGTLKVNGVDSRQGLIEAWNGTKTGYYLKKFMDPATAGQYYYNTNHWVEFRYAEILLNYAEACIELGGADLQPGLDALNMVRNRAGLPDRVTTDQAEARAFLRHERAIEFFGEGHRWYDLRRWMEFGNVVENVYGMKIKEYTNGNFEWKLDLTDNEDTRSWASDKYYWLPIARDEMNKAPQLQQNPGY
jgi:hypothetical protein